MRDEVLKFAIKMDEVLNEHQPEKGDSWKTCKISFLKEKLVKEFNEWMEDTNEKSELVDIANICMMLYNRTLGISYRDLMKSDI